MAEFSKLVITRNGQALIARVLSGSGNVDFTKICTSSTQYTLEQLEGLDELSDVKQTGQISKVSRLNDVSIKVESAINNTDLSEGYYMRTIGLYAADPDAGEILYAVTVETSGNCYMPPYNGIAVSGAYVQLVTTVGNAENVTLEVDAAAVATIGDIQDLQNQVDKLRGIDLTDEYARESGEYESIRDYLWSRPEGFYRVNDGQCLHFLWFVDVFGCKYRTYWFYPEDALCVFEQWVNGVRLFYIDHEYHTFEVLEKDVFAAQTQIQNQLEDLETRVLVLERAAGIR